MSGPTKSDKPVNRLTRIGGRLTDVFDADREHRVDDRCIVLLDDGDAGAVVITGYEDESEALADMLGHLRAIMRASGRSVDFVFLDEDGVELVDGGDDG